jgi:3'5'-cyclic nucleotide phosphodiesterase
MSPDEVGPNQKTVVTSRDLHVHTYGIASDPLVKFAVVFSALIHDVGHTGVGNERLAIEEPALAERYLNKSIAEQRSVDIALELLLLPRFDKLRHSIYRTSDECRRFRQLLINCTLATDIFDKDLTAMRNHRWELSFHSKSVQETSSLQYASEPDDIHRKATIVIEHIIQASDVAHTMQHWHVYKKWNERLFQEMFLNYLAGRSRTDPAAGWFQGELWFFDNYVIPLAKKLKECGVFGVSSDENLIYAMQNRSEWEQKGRELVKLMRQNAKIVAKERGLSIDDDSAEDCGQACAIDETTIGDSSLDVSLNSESGEDTSLVNGSSASADHYTAGRSEVILIEVPPGKLNIVVDSADRGPVIHHIAQSSPLFKDARVGDIIMSIDDIPCTHLDQGTFAALMHSKRNQPRRFQIVRDSM